MRGTLTAARLFTLLLFLLLIGICAYWALQILAPRPAIAPSASIGDANAAANLAPAVTLFGSSSAVTAAASAPSNIQVTGVAEAGPNGVVILSVDGKPGLPYGINEVVSDGTTVKAVALDKVILDQRGSLVELKTPIRASTDVLSSGAGKPRTTSEGGSTTPPVPTRAAAPAPLPQPAARQPPRIQPPQPPQQQRLQQQQAQQQLQQQQLQQQQQAQQQQLQEQQLQQQQVQQQQVQQQVQQQQIQQQQLQQQQLQQLQQQQLQQQVQRPQVQPGRPSLEMNQQFQAGNPMSPGGAQPMQGAGQAGMSAPAVVSGQQQVVPSTIR